MTATGDTLGGSRLRQLARRSAADRAETQERCELCSEPIPADHRHLLDLDSRELMCACRACSLLFDRTAAGGGHYRLVPDRRLRLTGFDLPDQAWESLRVPVDMAFFFYSSQAERMVAFYPGPMGATESLLPLDAWRAIEDANPVVGQMEPDVEALLVDRAQGAREYRLLPIDECYALVGLIRTNWRGLTGGRAVWEEIARLREELDGRSKQASAGGAAGTRQTSSTGKERP
jgi:hypothetical protein